ncbi:MAG: hemolysin family protein [Acidobacteriota bacterium]
MSYPVTKLIGLAAALILSALFSLLEEAYSFLPEGARWQLSERKRGRGLLSRLHILRSPVHFAVILQLGRLLFLGILLILIADFSFRKFPHYSFLTALLLGGGVVFVFHLLLPRLFSFISPVVYLTIFLPLLRVSYLLLYPITQLLSFVGEAVSNRGKREVTEEAEEAAREEIKAYIDVGEERGYFEKDEGQLIKSAVEFGDTMVREVMTPRVDMVCIKKEATVGDLKRLLKEKKYSRIPVYSGQIDNIVGIISTKEVFGYLGEEADDNTLTPLMRPPYFVPETKGVGDLLRELQIGKRHIAVVVDEYGGTAGLVTIEDILEEIVGEIWDEYDQEAEPIVREGDGVIIAMGKTDVDEVSQALGVDLREEGFETISGLVFNTLGRIPKSGESFEHRGVRIDILEADQRRIRRVRVTRL